MSKKIAVTMRGGGMRSVIYAGALQAFDEMKVPIDFIAGVSGGAVVSASYAFGKKPQEILGHFKNFNPLAIFNPLGIIDGTFLNSKKWEIHARKLIPEGDIQDAKIKLFIEAVNLDSGNVEYLEKGDAVKAVIASSTLVGSFKFGKKRYIDGGFDPELGVKHLRKAGAEKVFGLILNSSDSSYSLLSPFARPFQIMEKNAMNMDIKLNPPDYLIRYTTRKGWLFGRQNLDALFDRGYKVTKDYLKTHYH